MLLVVLVQSENEGLNSQMGKAVGGGGKYICDGRVHSLIIARIGAKLRSVKDIWAYNVEQVVTECDYLREKRENLLLWHGIV